MVHLQCILSVHQSPGYDKARPETYTLHIREHLAHGSDTKIRKYVIECAPSSILMASIAHSEGCFVVHCALR